MTKTSWLEGACQTCIRSMFSGHCYYAEWMDLASDEQSETNKLFSVLSVCHHSFCQLAFRSPPHNK